MGARTRQRIVGAARDEFVEYGYADATYQRIAQRVGCTRPLLNHYFASKPALYLEVVEQTQTQVVDSLADALGLVNPTSMTEFSTLLTSVVTLDAQDRSLAAFLLSSVREIHHPHVGAAARSVVSTVQAYLGAMVRSSGERGELRADTDVAAVVATLISVLWGVGFHATGITDDRQREVFVDYAAKFLAGTL